ncbi:MAG TPA: hypothetical protein VHL11_11105, partial [Phototrophicaceae bacterium]|nr:hypothetical protein [Phototrophicaceae bacterium]
EAAVNIHRLPGQGLVSLPFSTYPSFIYYRPALFDAAGLAYPPHSFGELYDGATWDTAKLREISMLLTLDINGKNATDIDFDPNQIVQWGFTQQFSELRGYVTMFGASHPIDATGTAFLPTPYADGFPWYYDGMWVDHFIPNAEQKAAMDNNPFMSGKLAMANSHLWYTCCAGVNDWDIAVVPSYNGVYTAKLHDDGFRIMETTEHPQEAFTVLTYLIGEAAPDLLAVYHGMPARPADQPAFFAALDADFPQGVDWQVAMDSINYADSPNLEAMIPNYQVAYDRLVEFQLLIESTDGLDIATELADLIADLQIIASERLADGGFEGELLYFWSQKNVTGDKVKCNTPEKQVAFEGECAYRFKGGVGEKSKLIQNAETVYVLAGKDLTLSGMVNAKGAPNATVKVIVTYQNTSLPKGKLKAKINAPTSGYQPLTGNLSLTLSDDALAIKVQFGNKSVSGKIYLDALSLTTTGSATANLISLPPLPALPLP